MIGNEGRSHSDTINMNFDDKGYGTERMIGYGTELKDDWQC